MFGRPCDKEKGPVTLSAGPMLRRPIAYLIMNMPYEPTPRSIIGDIKPDILRTAWRSLSLTMTQNSGYWTA